MEEITDGSIFQAILTLKEYNENNDEINYRKMICKRVEAWEKAAQTHNYKLKSYSEEEAIRARRDLKSWRPTQYEFSIYHSINGKWIKDKSKEVRNAENLLKRLKNEINEVIK
tara:strand:- start:271 stop:609 length:339 start_codon:yes stop_codon:yes gene_type:complete